MTRSKIKLFKSYLLLLGGSLIPLFMFISFLYQLNVSQNIVKLKSEKKIILNLSFSFQDFPLLPQVYTSIIMLLMLHWLK